MKCVCEQIEHIYGGAANLQHLADQKKLFCIGCLPRVLIDEVKSTSLMSNVCACFHPGNNVVQIINTVSM